MKLDLLLVTRLRELRSHPEFLSELSAANPAQNPELTSLGFRLLQKEMRQVLDKAHGVVSQTPIELTIISSIVLLALKPRDFSANSTLATKKSGSPALRWTIIGSIFDFIFSLTI